jgi:hypothetical protein
MAITLSSSGIGSTDGVLNLSDGAKSLKIKSGKIIETSSYIVRGTYVFKKGIDIPLVYFTQRRSTAGTNGTFTYNTTTDTVSSASKITYTKTTPEYIAALKEVIAYVASPTFKVSQVVSNVGYSSSIGTAEANQFNSTHDFTVSRYSLSNKAPSFAGNLESMPNTSNIFNTCSVSDKNIQVTCKTNNNSFISISVRL